MALAAVLALTVCLAGEAAAPRIAVSRPPEGLRAGQDWTVQVRVRGARPAAFVVARGRRVRRLRLKRAGTRYRAVVTFPAAGRWRYGVRIGKRNRFVGSVLVRPAVPALGQPYGIVEEPQGTILVGDFRAGAILRLNPATGDGAVLVRVPEPRDLRATDGGRLLVSSRNTVLEVDPVTRRLRVRARAAGALEGIAPAEGGAVYAVEEQSRIVRLDADGTRRVLADGLNGVHGILLTAEGVVVCESFAGNVRLVTQGGVATIAVGLGNPSYAAPAPDGRLYVSEFSTDRVSLVERSGRVTEVARIRSPGPIALERTGRLLVGTIDGRIFRVDPETGRSTVVWPR